MVIDNIQNADRYLGVHNEFREIFRFLRNLNENIESGKIVLKKNTIWVNVSNVKLDALKEERFFENHRDFIDIHYIISGEEVFGYSNSDCLKNVVPYIEDEDYELLKGEIQKFVLRKGDFCMVFPGDAHIPFLEKEQDVDLIRAVVKVKIDY